MKRKSKLPQTNRIVGISAMIISLLTLIIFIYQTNIISKQSKLSVKPRLSFNKSQTIIDSLVIFEKTLTNKGLGPAIIHNSILSYQKEDYALDFNAFVSNKFPDIEKYGNLASTTSISSGTSISPNETIIIYKFEAPLKNIPEIMKYLNIDSNSYDPNWNFELIYSSIYEDIQWNINDDKNLPIIEK